MEIHFSGNSFPHLSHPINNLYIDKIRVVNYASNNLYLYCHIQTHYFLPNKFENSQRNKLYVPELQQVYKI